MDKNVEIIDVVAEEITTDVPMLLDQDVAESNMGIALLGGTVLAAAIGVASWFGWKKFKNSRNKADEVQETNPEEETVK